MTFDDPKFVININKGRHYGNKTSLIMTLLHEAAHLKYAIVNKYEFSDAFLMDIWKFEEDNKIVPKTARRDIVKFELESLKLMPEIAQELNLRIPMYKVMMNMEQDSFVYKYFDWYGKFPTYKIEEENMKKLKEKYKR